ncbi:hypothetical protein G6F51_014682 [Rhizopus arrhizus]|uniref:Uncharacterized protein n=1 Tax=Rhizopus oryzae TaxID=64495 RepID=A0A9P7BXU3_RHIOR|nr:hypothetical protein G6F51_014682 [Rhizopus arrhizus]
MASTIAFLASTAVAMTTLPSLSHWANWKRGCVRCHAAAAMHRRSSGWAGCASTASATRRRSMASVSS